MEEASTTPHGSETIGWLAIAPGQGNNWNSHKYEAGQTPDAVQHNWYSVAFNQAFTEAPRFLAALASYGGGDNAHLRYRGSSLTASGVDVMIEEDTTYDSETNHTTEVVHYLAIEGDGTLTGKAYASDPSGQVVTKYYHVYTERSRSASGQPIAMRKDGTLYYILSDHLGSTSVLVDESGAVVARQGYYPYGGERYVTGNDPNSYTVFDFTGQRLDGTGLHFYNARYYLSGLGRFVSADTIVPGAGNPQAFNRYSYVLNNPLRFVDPTGHGYCDSEYALPEECAEDGEENDNEHPVFFDPGAFGFEPGVNVDILPYLFYQDPNLFKFEASVQYARPLLSILAAFATCYLDLIGQGCIPDAMGADENYPVVFEIYYDVSDPYGGRRYWRRGINTPDGYRDLFVAYWSVGEYKDQPVAVETFTFWGPGSRVVQEGTVYLRPIVGDPSLPIGQKDPLKWETVAFSRNGGRPFATNLVKVTFETRQTSPNSIRTIGRIFVSGFEVGSITLNGTYIGP